MSNSDYKKLTIKELRQKLQSTAPEGECETYTGRTIRFFSIFLTKILARTNLTPNQITVISVIIFLIGMGLFVPDIYWLHILGAIMVYISIIFDACDGEIARLKGNKSGIGAVYTEPVSHDIQYALMFIPLTLGVYLVENSVVIIYIGFIGTIAKLLTRFAQARFCYVTRQDVKVKAVPYTLNDARRQDSAIRRIYKFFNRNILSSVGLVFPLLFFALIDRVDLFIWFYSAGFTVMFFIHFIRQLVHILYLSK